MTPKFHVTSSKPEGRPRVTIIGGGWTKTQLAFKGPLSVQILRMRTLALFLTKSADLLESTLGARA